MNAGNSRRYGIVGAEEGNAGFLPAAVKLLGLVVFASGNAAFPHDVAHPAFEACHTRSLRRGVSVVLSIDEVISVRFWPSGAVGGSAGQWRKAGALGYAREEEKGARLRHSCATPAICVISLRHYSFFP